MSIRLGDKAPDFTAETTEGMIRFHEFINGSWAVLFSHPKDYTPVCTTELGRVAHLKNEFEKRGVKIIGISVDSLDSHKGWIRDINQTQKTIVNFPLIADPKREVAELYDMLDPDSPDNLTARNVYVIGPDQKVKLMITYPASTGRNFEELLRVIDSVQLTANFAVATPADWKQGDDCIIVPSVKDEDIPGKFPKGHSRIKPYLRTTPQPDI